MTEYYTKKEQGKDVVYKKGFLCDSRVGQLNGGLGSRQAMNVFTGESVTINSRGVLEPRNERRGSVNDQSGTFRKHSSGGRDREFIPDKAKPSSSKKNSSGNERRESSSRSEREEYSPSYSGGNGNSYGSSRVEIEHSSPDSEYSGWAIMFGVIAGLAKLFGSSSLEKRAKSSIVEIYLNRRNYRFAASVAEEIRDFGTAMLCHERSNNLEYAVHLGVKNGLSEEAQEMLVRNGKYERAAHIARDDGNIERAIGLLETQGSVAKKRYKRMDALREAAHIARDHGMIGRAIKLYERATPHSSEISGLDGISYVVLGLIEEEKAELIKKQKKMQEEGVTDAVPVPNETPVWERSILDGGLFYSLPPGRWRGKR